MNIYDYFDDSSRPFKKYIGIAKYLTDVLGLQHPYKVNPSVFLNGTGVAMNIVNVTLLYDRTKLFSATGVEDAIKKAQNLDIDYKMKKLFGE